MPFHRHIRSKTQEAFDAEALQILKLDGVEVGSPNFNTQADNFIKDHGFRHHVTANHAVLTMPDWGIEMKLPTQDNSLAVMVLLVNALGEPGVRKFTRGKK